MAITINLDPDLVEAADEALDLKSEWFCNLPVSVQIEKLRPYLQLQTERDRVRYGLELEAA